MEQRARNPSDPLVFHVLTPLLQGAQGFEQFKTLIAERALLAPASFYKSPDRLRLRKGWAVKSKAGLVFNIDRAAGDDAWIFFTLCEPYENRGHKPALVFRLRDLARAENDVGFRPHDLESTYKDVARGVECDDYGADDDEEYEPTGFDCIGQELAEVADAGTARGGRTVVELAAFHVEAARGRDTWDDAKQFIPRDGLPETEGGTLPRECDVDFDDGRVCKSLQENLVWRKPFEAGPDTGARGPEVLFGRQLPFAAAVAYRDGDGVWHDMPRDVARRGALSGLGGLGSIGRGPILAPDPWMRRLR